MTSIKTFPFLLLCIIFILPYLASPQVPLFMKPISSLFLTSLIPPIQAPSSLNNKQLSFFLIFTVKICKAYLILPHCYVFPCSCIHSWHDQTNYHHNISHVRDNWMWNTPVDSHCWLYVVLYDQLASFWTKPLSCSFASSTASVSCCSCYTFTPWSDTKYGTATTASSGVASEH